MRLNPLIHEVQEEELSRQLLHGEVHETQFKRPDAVLGCIVPL